MSKFDKIIALIEPLRQDSHGKWHGGIEDKQPEDNTFQMPFVAYTEIAHKLIFEIQDFVDQNPDYELRSYVKVLKERNIEFSQEAFNKVDLDNLDAQGVMAMLVGLMRAERFCEGAFLKNLQNGFIVKCIKRLEIITNTKING